MHITISGWQKADTWLATGRYDAMISISDPGGTKRGTIRTGNDLLLDFHDSWPKRGRKENGLATPTDAQKIVEFGQELAGKPVCPMVLVHCGRGRSRSTAAAILLLFAAGNKTPEWCCRHVFAIGPKSSPNAWLLELGETALGLKHGTFAGHCFGRAKGLGAW